YSSLYPTWVVRFVHKDRVRYINRGHGETQRIDGKLHEIKNDLIDENLKGIDEWFARQNRYSSEDALYELDSKIDPQRLGDLFGKDPLKRRAGLKELFSRMPGRTTLFFLYCYVWKGGFRDGRDGFMFCYMKSLYQSLIVIKKYDNLRVGK
ncbi:MAG: hypothetical protein OEU36_20935, partial [Gammaproteobacteria bacterium]|nr:hypothetical protein [Gammaproteobacteria bacterium]